MPESLRQHSASRARAMARWNLSSWLSHSVTQQPYVPATPAAVRGQVYVQELPARFNADVDTQLRHSSGIAYRASRVLHEFVRSSEARALRAQDANVIWVPLYTGFVGRRRILNHASKLHEVDAENKPRHLHTRARAHAHARFNHQPHTIRWTPRFDTCHTGHRSKPIISLSSKWIAGAASSPT